MKNIIFLFALAIPFLTFSQKLNNREKELFNTFKKSYYYHLITKYDNQPEKEYYHLIKFYHCMKKNYNINPMEYVEFMTKEDLIKKNIPFDNDIYLFENNSLYFNSYIKHDYLYRIANQKVYKKCIKKSDIDY